MSPRGIARILIAVAPLSTPGRIEGSCKRLCEGHARLACSQSCSAGSAFISSTSDIRAPASSCCCSLSSALRMKDRALTSVSATAMGVKVLTQNLAFILFLITGLFVLALSGQASNLLILMASSLSLMIIFAGLIAVYIISSKARIRNSVKWLLDLVNFTANKLKHAKNGILRKLSGQKIEHKARDILDSEKILDRLSRLHDNYLILKRHHRELRRPLGYGILANLTELATIYIVFVANGYWPNPGAIIIGYAVASFAGIVSVVPGGVGLFEALMVGVMVSAGIPAGVSISATVMYRIINTLISMPVGYYLYHKQLNKNAKLNLQTAKTASKVNDVPSK